VRIFLVLIFWLLSWTAHAVEFTAPQNAPINNTTPCTSPLIRTFQVNQNFVIADVDLGFAASHTWRGDIGLTLISPASTQVELVTPIVTGAGNIDNYNIILDDAAIDLINTGNHTTPDSLGAPPYENLVRPNNPLSVFNGEASQGTWTLEICDDYPPADNGTFDIATLFLTEDISPPSAGTPLTCPIAEQIPFVWGGSTNSWAAGTLINGYTAGTIPLSFAITGDTNRLIARNGQATPVTDDELTGGGAPQDNLQLYADFPDTSETITLTVNLGTPNLGVASVGFDVFDIDSNNWTDQLTVTGTLGGTSVVPNLTGSLSNTVSGNQVIGTANTASNSGAANAEIVFTSPVDQIVLVYSNGPSAPANPAAQIMGFFANMKLCTAEQADISAVKSVEIADPSQGIYMVPGSELIYKITVTNSANATAAADDIAISDTLPNTLTFLSASTTGFTGGSLSNPAANTDCSTASCVIGFSGGSLPEDSIGEVLVHVRIQ